MRSNSKMDCKNVKAIVVSEPSRLKMIQLRGQPNKPPSIKMHRKRLMIAQEESLSKIQRKIMAIPRPIKKVKEVTNISLNKTPRSK